MIQYLKQNKILAAGAAVAVFGILYYAFFFTSSSSPAPSLTSSSDAASVPMSQKLVVMLTSLNTIRLNNAVFQDPVFQSLADFGVVIPQQSVGRRNPFAPLQGGAAPSGQKIPTSPASGR